MREPRSPTVDLTHALSRSRGRGRGRGSYRPVGSDPVDPPEEGRRRDREQDQHVDVAQGAAARDRVGADREGNQEAGAAQRKKVNEDENNGIAQLEKDGMKVTRKVDGAAFREALKPAYAGYSKEFGADNIKKITDVQ